MIWPCTIDSFLKSIGLLSQQNGHMTVAKFYASMINISHVNIFIFCKTH